MNELKIEKKVSIPIRGKGFANALRHLKVGDSVVFPRTQTGIHSFCARYLGVGNYTTRKVDGNATRIWRIK